MDRLGEGGVCPSSSKFEGRIRVLLNAFFKCKKLKIPTLLILPNHKIVLPKEETAP